MKQMQNV